MGSDCSDSMIALIDVTEIIKHSDFSELHHIFLHCIKKCSVDCRVIVYLLTWPSTFIRRKLQLKTRLCDFKRCLVGNIM